MGAFDLPTNLASLWIDSSVQMMRAASAFWNGALGGAPVDTPRRSLTSTASPWWKLPEPPSSYQPMAAWAAMWFPAGATASSTYQAPGNPWMAAWAPMFPASPERSLGPIEMWQRAWLQSLPQLAALGASFARPAGAASLWPGLWPAAAPATALPPPVPAVWHPVAAAYRTANGHAMAAVLRTMADVVEPKPRTVDMPNLWLNPLATTRH